MSFFSPDGETRPLEGFLPVRVGSVCEITNTIYNTLLADSHNRCELSGLVRTIGSNLIGPGHGQITECSSEKVVSVKHNGQLVLSPRNSAKFHSLKRRAINFTPFTFP